MKTNFLRFSLIMESHSEWLYICESEKFTCAMLEAVVSYYLISMEITYQVTASFLVFGLMLHMYSYVLACKELPTLSKVVLPLRMGIPF